MKPLSLKKILHTTLAVTLCTTLFLGCQSSENEKQEPSSSLSEKSLNSTTLNTTKTRSLVETLEHDAQIMSENEFILHSVDTIVPSLVKQYVPSFYEEKVLGLDELQTKTLLQNPLFVCNLQAFYQVSTTPLSSKQRALKFSNLYTIVTLIAEEIQTIIVNYLFPDETIHYQEISNDINLRYKLMGEGNITIIFETGLGDKLSTWKKVQPEISKYAKTLSYDRSGLGKSTYSDEPRTSALVNTQLHELLEKIELKPPYILVGHSLGGVFIKTFTDKYPNEIVGQVYVDATDPLAFEKVLEYRTDEQIAYAKENNILFTFKSFIDFVDSFVPNYFQGVEAEFDYLLNPKFKEEFDTAKFSSTIATSILVNTKIEEDYVDELQPLSLLEKDRDTWVNLHKDWLKEMPQARFILLENSGHMIQDTEPEVLIEEIKTVLEEASSL